jgi:hypothetical protein
MDEVSRTQNRVKVPVEGNIMRVIFALAVIAASIALGGCFHHHTQQVVAAELPPDMTSIK